MRISADRAAYLSRVLHRRVLASPKLLLGVDQETLHRAIAREIVQAAQELETIEQTVRTRLESSRGTKARDFDLLLARGIEEELRKHGA
jgi:hypothetical protein